MTDWIIAVSSAISASTIVAIALQLILSSRQNRLLTIQLSTDHERSRRESAVRLLFEWSQLLDIRMSVARRVAESLSDEQARALWSGDTLTLPLESVVYVQICLEGRAESKETGCNIGNEGVVLKGRALSELKWCVVRYLNLLEAVFTSRRCHVSDSEIIDEQFGYLVSPASGKDVLGSIRKAAGGPSSLPAIEEFVRSQQAKASHLKPGKAPVVELGSKGAH